MAKGRIVLASGAILLAISGCMMVDKVSDPEGFQAGTYKPIFPWYPEYLFSRDAREYGRWWRENPEAMSKLQDPAAHSADCACCSSQAEE